MATDEYDGEESSGDEQDETGYENMPTEQLMAQGQVNLFQDITADISEAVMREKQDQFDTLTEEISRLLSGEIGDFYVDDCPSHAAMGDTPEEEMRAALGDMVRVEEMPSPTGSGSPQRKLVSN